jgi:hypothetical protein
MREVGRIFELHLLGQADRGGSPLGRLPLEVLGLSNACVTPVLGQELPGDSSHQTCRSQDCGIGLLAERSFAFIEVPEVGRATDGNPSGLDKGPAKPFVAMWQQFALESLTSAAADRRTQANPRSRPTR